MLLEATGAAILIALTSLIGALFFGNARRLIGSQRYIIPVAVGVFLSLVLYELIPETIAASPWGGIAVAAGFIAFYILAHILHAHFHDHDADEVDCDRRGAAMLLLIGDAVHNIADGVILGGAFLINPAVGVATAIGLALHEIPQEVVEFGVLVRAGYSRLQAALYNLLSASSIVVGTLLIFIIAEHGSEYVWIITGIAAGNLLYLAASDLLPRIHHNLPNYGNIWRAAACVTLGFVVMTIVLAWTHEEFGHGDTHTDTAHEDELHDEPHE